MARMRRVLAATALLGMLPQLALAVAEEEFGELLGGDDECTAGDEECTLSARQLRATPRREKEAQPDKVPELAIAADDQASPELVEEEASPSKGQEEEASPPEVQAPLQPGEKSDAADDDDDDEDDDDDDDDADKDLITEATLKSMWGGGWTVVGGKLWGRGRGIESVNGGNVGYYNSGMRSALARCSDMRCALVVNPAGHRTIETFHIHYFHFQGNYASNLKHKMEGEVCGKSGWHSGGLPCHGKAKFVSGFPGIFSTAFGGGGMSHASVIAWPSSCGGRGTIVQLAYGCSIEHQLRGDFDSSKR